MILPALHRRVVATAVAFLLSVGGVVVPSLAGTAVAEPLTIQQRAAAQVTADGLPTAQINGVAWAQQIVGDTVYVGGSFTSARPAGSAPGNDETPRSNLMAYSLSTGALLPFAPVLNQQVKAFAVSPDGSRLYVAGQFTSVNGVNRYRIAAFDTATGNLVSAFFPKVDYIVNALVATNDTVYAGGAFTASGTSSRSRLAAFAASNGALLDWAPTADAAVQTMILSPDGAKIVAGGNFTLINGSTAVGLAALSPATGATIPFAANSVVKNGGANSAILSLSSDGTSLFGGGFKFGSGGNLEGVFRANWTTGAIEWIEDCHGDTYGVFANASAVFQVGHAHYCGNNGGWSQPAVWDFQRAVAFSKDAAGTLIHEPLGYTNWSGKPAPAMQSWFPDLEVGTYTGKTQAAWTVTGNDQYVILGGEFVSVNGVSQQGLVRFAVKGTTSAGVTTGRQGPRVFETSFMPTLSSDTAGTVRVAFPANWDRDDSTLNYTVIRNGNTAVPAYVTTAESSQYNRPTLGFTDSGLTRGATYTYRVRVSDRDGNSVTGATASVSVATTTTKRSNAYSATVLSQGASLYWPLNETSGSAVSDGASFNDGVMGSGVTRGVVGAVAGDAAMTFSGAAGGDLATTGAQTAPNSFTVSSWFRTTSTRGGRIVGFSDLPTASSGHADRALYLNNTGKLSFGVWGANASTGSAVTGAASYNDGRWHQAVASLGAGGMTLYVDGARVASRADITAGEKYFGYWRLGGDIGTGLPGQGTSRYLAGSLDEVSVYPAVLTAQQVSAQFAAARSAVTGVAPTPAFSTTQTNLRVAVDGTGSSDADGTIASYGWEFGDGSTATGVTASHDYTAAGTYTVTLTVTDNSGLTAAQTSTVSVAPPANIAPTANFVASVQDLTGSFDAATSTDPDGSLVSYHWSFGDGAVATGSTASHEYAGPGNYQVTLTVTDNAGAAGEKTTSVQARSVNVAPVAVISAAAAGLTASVTGSGSTDEGSVTGWAWDFGDGVTATGVNAVHTYASAGSYAVTLVVTDDRGATGTVTTPVTVTAAPAAAASDTFNRTATSSWGVADIGGSWTLTGGASGFAVTPGAGKVTLTPGVQRTATLGSVSQTDVDVTVALSLDKMPAGGSTLVTTSARKVGTSDYRVTTTYSATGKVTVSLVRTVGNVATTLRTATVSGLTYAAGDTVNVRLQLIGTGTTLFQAKAWKATDAEPSGWVVTTTDTTPELQGAGSVALTSYLSGAATNAPVVVSVKSLVVTAP